METQLWAIGLVVLATIVGSLGPIYLKKASEKKLSSIKSLMKNYHLMLGFIFYGLGTVLFIPALKGGNLSVLYPFVSLAYIWVCLLSRKFLNEKINIYKWAGIGLIIFGVSFIGLGS